MGDSKLDPQAKGDELMGWGMKSTSIDSSKVCRRTLQEAEAKRYLLEHGIPCTLSVEVLSEDEALNKAAEIGYPVVLKVASPKIVHKSDFGGVTVDLRGPEEVQTAYERMLARAREVDPSASISVQRMAPAGFEMIVGVTFDHHFGHVLMLGAGGILAELLKDTAFGLMPVSRPHLAKMLSSLRSYPVLSGYRGQAKGDVNSLIDIIESVNSLIMTVGGTIELDLNPVIVHSDGSTVVDARIVLEESPS